ncbi:MAG TPA: hypothetical protein VLD37_01110 [Candidatus Bilamarchaeum sp.]|nr:hypothetical protein [Candidatus Bilamarchaeum sp.]
MNKALFVAGLAFLLLLGCVGGRTYKSPTPSPAQPAGEIGDRDLTTGSEKEDDVMPEEIIPPPDEPSSGNSSILVDLDDLSVENYDDSDMISDELIVGPN